MTETKGQPQEATDTLDCYFRDKAALNQRIERLFRISGRLLAAGIACIGTGVGLGVGIAIGVLPSPPVETIGLELVMTGSVLAAASSLVTTRATRLINRRTDAMIARFDWYEQQKETNA